MRINDTVTFVEDGFDEDIEFGDEISDDDEDDVDNVSFMCLFEILYIFYLFMLHHKLFLFSVAFLYLFLYNSIQKASGLFLFNTIIQYAIVLTDLMTRSIIIKKVHYKKVHGDIYSFHKMQLYNVKVSL